MSIKQEHMNSPLLMDFTKITENNILTIMTGRTSPFKSLITALKDIILETEIIFTNQGIKIINMDQSHTVVVYLDLPAEKFDFYECKKEKIIIGVNLLHLHKLISMIENNDRLTIYIENKSYDEGFVSQLFLKFDNMQIKQSTIHQLKLQDVGQGEEIYPDIKYSSIITIPSTDFQKIIRNLSSICQKVEIKSVGNELIFKSIDGPFASTEIKRTESEKMSFIKKDNPSKITQGIFSLKNLSYFIKCTNLCNQIELYLENDIPLVIQYDVASLGTLRLCLATT